MRGAFDYGMIDMASVVHPYDHSHEKTIHSGHFMVSCVHEDGDDQQGEDKNLVVNNNNSSNNTRQLKSILRKPDFQSLDGSIDSSLAGLFRQMTLAYSGKLVSPKWKNFKGIKLKLKEKIRLNNIIWREWFMQYIQKKNSIVCQFEVPAFEKTHCSPEAIVLEGKYWKRQFECLTTEYKKWRLFYKEKFMRRDASEFGDILERICGSDDRRSTNDVLQDLGDQFLSFIDSDSFPNFHDNLLFSNMAHPLAFPDPREIMEEGYSRMFQPQLLQLQPTIIDQMEVDDNDPLHERSSRSFRHDPSHSNQMNFECDRWVESVEIDKIQKQLMNEENEILKSSQNASNLRSQYSSICASNDQNYTWTSDALFDDSFKTPLDTAMTSNIFTSQPVETNQQVNQDSIQSGAFNASLPGLFLQDFHQPPNFSDNFVVIKNVQFDDQMFRTNEIQTPTLVEFNQFGNQCFKNQQNILTDCHSFAFPNQSQSQQMCDPQLMDDNHSFNEKLEAERRRASTGSLAITRNKDKKHVSFAVPNLPMRQKPQRSDHPRFGVLKPSKPLQPSLLEQLLLQGKTARHVNNTTNTFQIQPQKTTPGPPQFPEIKRGRKSKKSNNNNNNVVASGDQQINRFSNNNYVVASADQQTNRFSNNNNVVASADQQINRFSNNNYVVASSDQQINRFSCNNSNILESHCKNLPHSTSEAPFIHQNISVEQKQLANSQPANQQLQIILFQDSSTHLNQSSLSSTQCDPMNVRFEVQTNEKQAIQFNTLQTFNQVIQPAPTHTNYQDVSNHHHHDLHFIGNQLTLFPAHIQEGPIIPQYVMEKPIVASRLSDQVRSRHSSNDSSSGHGTSDSLKDRKKTYHMSAEHQRRCMIKQGFDTMNELVPDLRVLGIGKINKASTLSKGAEYIKALRHEKESTKDLMQMCRNEVEQLTSMISELQQSLPASGIYSPQQKPDGLSAMMTGYVHDRTMKNWKFWIFSVVMRSWMDSYKESVVTNSREKMGRSVMMWLDTKCSLPTLREGVLSSLPHLCKVTSILENPLRLPQEALAAANLSRQRPQGR